MRGQDGLTVSQLVQQGQASAASAAQAASTATAAATAAANMVAAQRSIAHSPTAAASTPGWSPFGLAPHGTPRTAVAVASAVALSSPLFNSMRPLILNSPVIRGDSKDPSSNEAALQRRIQELEAQLRDKAEEAAQLKDRLESEQMNYQGLKLLNDAQKQKMQQLHGHLRKTTTHAEANIQGLRLENETLSKKVLELQGLVNLTKYQVTAYERLIGAPSTSMDSEVDPHSRRIIDESVDKAFMDFVFSLRKSTIEQVQTTADQRTHDITDSLEKLVKKETERAQQAESAARASWATAAQLQAALNETQGRLKKAEDAAKESAVTAQNLRQTLIDKNEEFTLERNKLTDALKKAMQQAMLEALGMDPDATTTPATAPEPKQLASGLNAAATAFIPDQHKTPSDSDSKNTDRTETPPAGSAPTSRLKASAAAFKPTASANANATAAPAATTSFAAAFGSRSPSPLHVDAVAVQNTDNQASRQVG